MKKIDLHLHLTLEQLPKQENGFISSAENMLPHLEELGIEKGVLMPFGETSPMGSNEEVKAICKKLINIHKSTAFNLIKFLQKIRITRNLESLSFLRKFSEEECKLKKQKNEDLILCETILDLYCCVWIENKNITAH